MKNPQPAVQSQSKDTTMTTTLRSPDHTLGVLDEVAEQIARFEAEFGQMTMPILDDVLLDRPGGCTKERMCEEYGVYSSQRQRNNASAMAMYGNGITFMHSLVLQVTQAIESLDDSAAMRKELIGVAGLAVKMVECIDRIDQASYGLLAKYRSQHGLDDDSADQQTTAPAPAAANGEATIATVVHVQRCPRCLGCCWLATGLSYDVEVPWNIYEEYMYYAARGHDPLKPATKVQCGRCKGTGSIQNLREEVTVW